MELTPQPAKVSAMPSAARSLGKVPEIFMARTPPKPTSQRWGTRGEPQAVRPKILRLHLPYLDGGADCALVTADALTGAPCSRAFARMPAQSASLAKPGSTKARMAANGDNRANPAPMAPWVRTGLLSTPRTGAASLPDSVIGAFRCRNWKCLGLPCKVKFTVSS